MQALALVSLDKYVAGMQEKQGSHSRRGQTGIEWRGNAFEHPLSAAGAHKVPLLRVAFGQDHIRPVVLINQGIITPVP